MFGGNTYNSAVLVSLDENCLLYLANASNSLQLFENVQLGCNVDPVFVEEHNSSIFWPNKRGRESEALSRQISLSHNIYFDEADRAINIPNQNPVSTGLRLSYDDDEHNSSITSASGSVPASPSIILSLGDNIKIELGRQKDEFDQCRKKLGEKDLEIENINRKNRELFYRIKHVATEAQNWQYLAKYNESVINILKNNLR
ncbi:hypothetical protein RJ639_037549 [Escallonia herrerae]|uniref:Uncharacterized protein n=1 Tax=Escallonia herrerae TaxID=1293975 RepID=A0AA89B706_9ASTE|nr:hypothetical protein RJ639_037549 [Escallonia herrerae]